MDLVPAPLAMDDNYGAFGRIDWPVRTRRLTLRPAVAEDAPVTWLWRRLPEVSNWLGSAPDRQDYLTAYRSTARLTSTVIVELQERPIGDLMIRLEDAWVQAEVVERGRGVQAELGWTLDPAFQGHGYATEAVSAAIGLCFGPLGLRRIEARCFAANEPSWRLMERVGMRREQYSVAESLHRSGEWLDGMCYALLATEWRPED